MVVEFAGNEPPVCSEDNQTLATYMIRGVGDVARPGQPAQTTMYACKRHLTKIVDGINGSAIVRKL